MPKETLELAKADLTKAKTEFQKQLTENVGISTGVGFLSFSFFLNCILTFYCLNQTNLISNKFYQASLIIICKIFIQNNQVLHKAEQLETLETELDQKTLEKVREGKVESKIKLSATKSAKQVGSHTESMSVEGFVSQSLKDDEEQAKTVREPVQDELAVQHAKQTGVHNICKNNYHV